MPRSNFFAQYIFIIYSIYINLYTDYNSWDYLIAIACSECVQITFIEMSRRFMKRPVKLKGICSWTVTSRRLYNLHLNSHAHTYVHPHEHVHSFTQTTHLLLLRERHWFQKLENLVCQSGFGLVYFTVPYIE